MKSLHHSVTSMPAIVMVVTIIAVLKRFVGLLAARRTIHVLSRTMIVSRKATSVLLTFAILALPIATRPSREILASSSSGNGYRSESGALEIPPDTVVPPDTKSVGTPPDTKEFATGTLPGKSSVDPDGAARYTMPLWVPPGRNGMQPDLTLSYNSRTGNGPMGVGWSLPGFSEIQRCHLNHAIDGKLGPITFDAKDPFCLDGQRLMLVSGVHGERDATYKTERDTFAKIVIDEVQANLHFPTRFSIYQKDGRILRFGGDENFRTANRGDTNMIIGWLLRQIEDRYGNVIFFSYRHLKLAINPLSITYTGSLTNPHLIPNRRIQFSYERRPDVEFSAALGLAESTERLTRIEVFGPNEKMQQAMLRAYSLSYCGDKAIPLLPSGTQPPCSKGDPKASITNRSLLTSITESDASGRSLPATSFEWELGKEGFDRIDTGISDFYHDREDPARGPDTLFRGFQVFDMNGDGLDDLLYLGDHPPLLRGEIKWWGDNPLYYVRLSKGRGFGAPIVQYFAPARDDATFAPFKKHFNFPIPLLYDASEPPGLLLWATQNVSRPKDPPWPAIQQIEVIGGPNNDQPLLGNRNFVIQSPSFDPEKAIVIPMDMDGDGLADLVAADDFGTQRRWHFYRNLGHRSFDAPKEISFPPEFGRIGLFGRMMMPMRGVDIDGSGRQQLIACSPIFPTPEGNTETPGRVLTNTDGFSTDLITCKASLFQQQVPVFFDANADGLDDVVFPTDPLDFGIGRPSLGMKTILNRGRLDFRNPGLTKRIQGHELFAGIRVLDYDGDGHPDLVGTRAIDDETFGANIVSGIRIFRSVTTSEGIQLVQAFPNNSGSSLPFTAISNDDFELIQVGDVNGDGLQDLVTIQRGQFILYLRKGSRPDMLVRVVNGVGARARFRYAPISDPNVYKSVGYSRWHYPQRAVTGGLLVVAEHEVSNGSTFPDNVYLHHYEDAVEDIRGRGFLGFRAHDIEEQRNATTVRYEYDLSPLTNGSSLYPFAGLPSKETKTTNEFANVPGRPCNGLLRERIVTRFYDSHFDAATGIYAPSVTDTTVEDSECAGGQKTLTYRKTTRQAVDDYGNVRFMRTLFGNGDLYFATLTFDNSDSDWLIARKVKSVETSIVHSGRSQVRTMAYRYDVKGGLERIVVEPGDDSGSEIKPLPQPQRDGVSTLFLRYDRDTNGQVTRVAYDVDFISTPKERFTQFFYEDADQIFLTRINNKLGHSQRFAFHPGLGVQAAALDANGIKSRWQYDTFGRLKRSEPGGAEASSMSYLAPKAPVIGPPGYSLELMQAGDSGWKISTHLDSLGRQLSNTVLRRNDGKGVQIGASYDAWGRILSTAPPFFEGGFANGLNTFKYDEVGRLTRFATAEKFGSATGPVASYTYRGLQMDLFDADPRDAAAIKTTITKDTGGQIISSIQHARAHEGRPARDLAVQYEAGPFGVLQHINSLGSVQVDMKYDRLGRLLTLADPSRGRRDYTYNAFGELIVETIAKTGAAPENRQYEYDDLGRISLLTTRDGITKYKWDESAQGLGQMASVTSPQHVVTTFRYDALGRVSGKTWQVDGEQFEIGTDYDSFGRLQRVRYPDTSGRGFAVRYKYGVHGSLQTIVNDTTSAPYWTVLEIDEAGLPTNPSGAFPQAELGNGVTTRWVESVRKPGQLGAIHTTSGNGLVQDLNYNFDRKGNLESRQDTLTNTTERFLYDELNRLQRWIIPGLASAYNYDDLGNLRERVQAVGSGQNVTYDYAQTNGAGPYAVSAINGSPYSYNQEGNQIKSPGRQVTFSTFGLPLNIDDGSRSYHFGYDGFGSRVFRRSNDNREVLTIAGLYERRSEGSGLQFFTVMGPYGPIGQVVRQSSGTLSDTVRYIHGDNLGSTESVTDENGKIVETRQYDPFGNLIGFSLPGHINVNGKRNNGNAVCGGTGNCFGFYQNKLTEFSITGVSMGFTGHRDDGDINLINMVGRIYDPKTGRFLTPDPFVPSTLSTGGMNSYAYVMNNPVTLVDPTGFEGEFPPPNQPSGPPEERPGPQPGELGTTQPDPNCCPSPRTSDKRGYNPVDGVIERTEAARIQYQTGNRALAGRYGTLITSKTQLPGAFDPDTCLYCLTGYEYRDLNGYAYHQSRILDWTPRHLGDLYARVAMDALQSDPNRFFPFQVVGQNGERRITRGAVYELSNRLTGWALPLGSFPVRVTEVTPTSFTFTALRGHFDPEGSTITFSTRVDIVGTLRFEHFGVTTRGNSSFTFLFAPFLAARAWDIQADNLRRWLRSGK